MRIFIAKNWKDKNMPAKSVNVAKAYLETLPHLDPDAVLEQLDFTLADVLANE